MIKTISLKDPEFGPKFLSSLKDTGFAVITDHEIPKRLLDDAKTYWVNYFSLPREVKMLNQFNPNKDNQDGYFPFKSENAKGQKLSDLKEFYHYYKTSQAPMSGISPTDETQSGSEILEDLFFELNSLGVYLLKKLNIQLPNNVWGSLSEDLELMAHQSESTLLRAIHYPPINSKDAEQGAVRAAAHEDINLITLLPAATASGLEVMDTQGNWIPVQEVPDSIVVNAGDMLQLATGGYIKSTTHRVVNTEEGYAWSRYSMPMFIHPKPEVKLSPDKTAGEYLIERLKEIGLKK